MVQVYGQKTKRRRNVKKFTSEPISDIKLKISMTVFGLLAIAMGIWFEQIVIRFQGTPIEDYVFAVLVVIIGFIQLLTVGLKRFTKISYLTQLSNEQILTIGTALITIILALLNVSGLINSFGIFANGILIAQGLLILLEVFR